ncbi:MAG: thioredoxin family protein [Deltaproteobacteria bacterium]|nr:thioredoxin family protein [Deltaproteobacteria bacterium]
MLVVDFIYDDDCPNVEAARRNLRDALLTCNLPERWTEHRIGDPGVPARARGFGSPTILVDGKDVAGAEASAERCCRVYPTGGGVPSVELICAALERANDSRPRSA